MDRPESFAELAGELGALFREGARAALDDARFDALALRVFAFQYASNATYRGFCRGRGVSPATVGAWQGVPAVPATAFRFLDLIGGDPGAAEATYVSSGTTGGPGSRSRHPVASVPLYRASALAGVRAWLVPEDMPLPVLSLIPSPADAPESSLSAMMGFVGEAFGDPVWWLGHPARGPDAHAYRAAAAAAAADGRPALVAATTFALVQLLDMLEAGPAPAPLPLGSRLMETGGFKGRSRVVERDVLHLRLESRLGVRRDRIVSEYGMTELLSQMWEPVLEEGPGARGRHVPPPWLKVRALDPVSLAPLPPGEPGLLAFFDLANVGSVSHVLTEDVGSVSSDGIRLAGRAPGAEPRGCSLALEELLSARGGEA